MNIEIEVVKRAVSETVNSSELAYGDYYCLYKNGAVYRRVQVSGQKNIQLAEHLWLTSSEDGHCAVKFAISGIQVYPCHPDGTLKGAEPVATVRISKIPVCSYYKLNDGNIYQRLARYGNNNAIRLCDGGMFYHADAHHVTPFTITKIVGNEGAKA